jgi:hypothetical protein
MTNRCQTYLFGLESGAGETERVQRRLDSHGSSGKINLHSLQLNWKRRTVYLLSLTLTVSRLRAAWPMNRSSIARRDKQFSSSWQNSDGRWSAHSLQMNDCWGRNVRSLTLTTDPHEVPNLKRTELYVHFLISSIAWYLFKRKVNFILVLLTRVKWR